MIIGRALGLVKTIHRIDELPEGPLRLVRIDDLIGLKPNEAGQRHREHVVAFDLVGCAENQKVLLVEGLIASEIVKGVDGVVDAVIVAVVSKDELLLSPKQPQTKP